MRSGCAPIDARCCRMAWRWATDAVPAQPRVYDAVWIGRVHRQKGIDDLLNTLAHLAQCVPHFKCIFIGNLRESMGPMIAARGLERHVEFSGFVSEEEKIRLFKRAGYFSCQAATKAAQGSSAKA